MGNTVNKRKKRTYSLLTLAVIGYVGSKKNSEVYGAEITLALMSQSGSIYPILARLVTDGIAVSRKEVGNERELGRPLRTYYKLTSLGESLADTYQLSNLPLVVSSLPKQLQFEF
jgi:DNA-binding PadR family transcriptional regulator